MESDAVVMADALPAVDMSTIVDMGTLPIDQGLPDSQASVDASADDEGVPGEDDAALLPDTGPVADGGPVSDAGSGIPTECEVTFRVTLSENTPLDEGIYLAGVGFGVAEWEPGLEELRMDREGLQASFTRVVSHLGRVTYKYTRGNWDTVETTAQCGVIDNRVLVADCLSDDPSTDDEILSWADRCQ